MLNKQYSIGEFAAINKLSTRMLRHYDKVGLLKPAAILPNGYRAYSSEQIAALSEIKRYQSCGFTLSEIGGLLQAGAEQVAALAKAKQAELRARDAGADSTYERLCGLLGELPPSFENRYEPSFTLQEERLLFLCDAPVTEEQIESSFDRLYGALDLLGASPTGLPMLLLEETGDARYRTAAPVKQALFHSGTACKVLPGGWYLSTVHFGDYDSIGAAYDCLLRHAAEQGRGIEPPFIERYFLDGTHAAGPSEYITEVSVKITP